MGDFRRHKKDSYTCIDNHVFKDHTLSMKAKGLLTQIYSLPDDWEYSVTGLAKLFYDGKDSVNTALQELIKHGYIVRTQRTDETGRFAGYEYDIYETPQTNVEENPSTGEPFTENPSTDKPSTENQAQLNTNIETTNRLNTNEENTNEDISPLISPDEKLNLLFACFWKVYPKKANKKDAFKAFKGIKDIEKILPDIITDVEEKKQTKDWQKMNGQYIPYPASYLRGERWKDVNEVAEKQAKIDEIAAENIDMFLL